MDPISLTLESPRLAGITVPLGTSWLLATCMESKGKQDLWTQQKPEILESLREQAIIQSVESSNRIEGVTVTAQRLRPLVMEGAKPRDRPEEELAGYRRALRWIYTRKGRIALTPALIQHLHELAQSGSAFTAGGGAGEKGAGEWKQRNDDIIEILPNGDRRVRFVPASAKATPGLIAALCRNYEAALQDQQVPPLLLAATFVFDFLCIHPFRDGNGRVSRLLTALLLESQGIQAGRYISLDRLIEEAKDDYFRVLAECSRDWQKGTNQILPWWTYFLGILRAAYREFEIRVTTYEARPARSELVRHTVLQQAGEFTLADIAAQVPNVSPPLVKKVLAALKADGQIELTGHGRGARWQLRAARSKAVKRKP